MIRFALPGLEFVRSPRLDTRIPVDSDGGLHCVAHRQPASQPDPDITFSITGASLATLLVDCEGTYVFRRLEGDEHVFSISVRGEECELPHGSSFLELRVLPVGEIAQRSVYPLWRQ